MQNYNGWATLTTCMYMYCFKFHDLATDKSTNCLLWLFRMQQLVIYILMKSFLVILLEYHGHVMGYEKKWWMIWTQASIISCLVLYELCYMAKTNKLVWPLHSSPLMIIYVTTSMVLSAARIRFTGQFQGLVPVSTKCNRNNYRTDLD